jgi:hypothetical protein
MSTAPKCRKCDGAPLKTGDCDPRVCTNWFGAITLPPHNFICYKCGHHLDADVKGHIWCSNCGQKYKLEMCV